MIIETNAAEPQPKRKYSAQRRRGAETKEHTVFSRAYYQTDLTFFAKEQRLSKQLHKRLAMDEAQYYNLIVRHLSGQATEQEQRHLQTWRAASNENEQLFNDIQNVWEKSPQDLPDRSPDVDNEWRRIEDELDFGEKKGPGRILAMKPKRETSWLFSGTHRALALAAAVAIVVIGAFAWRAMFNQPQTFVTRNAEQREITLPDGSVVRMHSGSEIRYAKDFSNAARSVFLKGEAFFEVSHDGRPFYVRTDNARVQVLGTAFNVWARHRQTTVIVKEGRVSLNSATSPEQAVVLVENQTSSVVENQAPAEPAIVEADRMIGWLNDMLVFDAMPLGQIVSELEYIYDVKIELAKEAALQDTTLTGTFKKKPLDSILASICLALELNYTREGDTYVITTKDERKEF